LTALESDAPPSGEVQTDPDEEEKGAVEFAQEHALGYVMWCHTASLPCRKKPRSRDSTGSLLNRDLDSVAGAQFSQRATALFPIPADQAALGLSAEGIGEMGASERAESSGSRGIPGLQGSVQVFGDGRDPGG